MNRKRSTGGWFDGFMQNINSTIGKSNPKLPSKATITTITTDDNYRHERTRTIIIIIDDRERTPCSPKPHSPSFFTGHIRPNERTPLACHPTERSSLAETHSFDPLPFNHLDQSRSPKGVDISLPSFPCSPAVSSSKRGHRIVA